MNNAAIGPDTKSWELLDNWRSTFEVNVFGYGSLSSEASFLLADICFSVVNVQQTFVPVRVPTGFLMRLNDGLLPVDVTPRKPGNSN